jgi:hypothetical protein
MTTYVAGRNRTLLVGAMGTLLVLAIFSTVVTTIGASARSSARG